MTSLLIFLVTNNAKHDVAKKIVISFVPVNLHLSFNGSVFFLLQTFRGNNFK